MQPRTRDHQLTARPAPRWVLALAWGAPDAGPGPRWAAPRRMLYFLAAQTRMANAPDPDATLLARARVLDAQALAHIHDQYYPALYRFALYRTSDPELAADIAGEVFVRLLDALHARRPPQTTLRGWLFGVAAHLVADHFRRAPAAELPETLADAQSVPAEAEANLARSDVRAGLRRLTEEQQQVLALRFGDGFSVEETATTLGKTVNATKALQFRAIEALRRVLRVEHE
jgi:RNA polymerase sigma-70 factor, ECF subfamily